MGRSRGGFSNWVRSFYSPKNGDRLERHRVDDQQPVLWECGCGCCGVYKSCHAVANNIRRWAPDHPTCFTCPAHAPLGQPRRLARKACEAVRAVLAFTGGGTVVWEAHLVPEFRAYDMWLWPHRIAVEIDGAQHFVGRCYATSAAEQAGVDRQKEQAAVRLGYHVVRLHHQDPQSWCTTLLGAVWAAHWGLPAQVHCTPAYYTP